MEFIQKLIDYAANNKQPVTNCVASRIVAGLEPNKTNELLQALARIATAKRSASNERRPRTFVKPLSSSPTTATTTPPVNSSSPTSSNQRVREISSEETRTSIEPKPMTNNYVADENNSTTNILKSVSPEGRLATDTTSRKDSFVSEQKQKQNLNFINITSESDINKNIAFLKINLKSLKTIGIEIRKTEALLKESLRLQLNKEMLEGSSSSS